MAHGPDGRWIGYGEGDTSPEVVKIDRRLLHAYPKNSRAVEHGVVVDDYYDAATANAVRDLAAFINRDPDLLLRMADGRRLDVAEDQGVANLAFRKAIGAYVPPVYRPKYPMQGVWADSRAFLNPPDARSFVKATTAFATEGYRLYSGMVGQPIIPIGYSMGGASVKKFLDRLPPEWREYVKMVITLGDPCMPAEGSLLGNDPGEGILKQPQPQWCRDRYWSFSIDGDWYPRARGLLFLLAEVLTRAELTLDFAVYLFTKFPLRAMQELLGIEPSDDPLAGALSGLAGLMTTGPTAAIGSLLNPMQLMAVLPDLVFLLFDAIKFIASNAHGNYANPAFALWDGMTAVDKAAALVREHCPDGATLFLFPGTWSNWDQLFQFDIAARLQ